MNCIVSGLKSSGEEASEKLGVFVKENFRYEPDSGHLYWTKQTPKAGKRRNLEDPIGTYRRGYLVVTFRVEGIQVTKEVHRIAWFLTYGYWPSVVDHINRFPGDNRLINLREVTQNGNSYNRPGFGKSKYKGVHFSKGKFTARIQSEGKRIYIGRFLTEEEAAKAYDEKAKLLHGKYAYLNFE